MRRRRTIVALATLAVAAGCGPSKAPSRSPEGGFSSLPSAPKELHLVRPARRASGPPSALMKILSDEMTRNVEALAKDDIPPYFVAYEVVEERSANVEASFGALERSSTDAFRNLDVDVRVGSHAFDNTHPLRGEWDESREYTQASWLPLTDDEAALRSIAWLTTHLEHQRAREDLGRVKVNQQILVDEENTSHDFSEEKAETYHEPRAPVSLDLGAWEEKVRRWSAPFAAHAELSEGRAGISVSAETRYILNSEGTRVEVARTHARVEISASTTAPDGMKLERLETMDVPDAASLPPDAAVLARVAKVTEDLLALRNAPLVEPSAVPAILDGRAAAVFFHEIFGHRVEGHRQKDEEEGGTFAHKIGEAVMPSFLHVYDDPSIAALNGTALNGYYPFDDEGVPGKRASLVEQGVLRGFVQSRSPLSGFPHSNGHGRRDHGHRVVSRQANLVVDSERTTTPNALKGLLLQEIARQKKPYGMRFHEITGGYTNTTRQGAQAFKVLPVIVYRIYPDGREELVRGVDLEGTPLSALSRIEAVANDFEVFNGVCGAESGWVPVSATSPSILVSQIEVTRQEKGQDRPPLLPPPAPATASPPSTKGGAP